MTSRITADFRKRFQKLPDDVQRQAKEAYRLWKTDPYHASLFFKQVSPNEPLYSVRIGQHWRALAIKEGNDLDWLWIGPHSHYDRLIKQI